MGYAGPFLVSPEIRLERLWQEELDKKGEEAASYKKAVLKFIRTRFVMSSLSIVASSSAGFLLTAYLLYQAIIYLESTDDSVGQSLSLAFSIFGATVMRVLGGNLSNYLNARSAVRLRSAVMMQLYRKVTRLRTTSRVSVGEMVNICVNDIQRMHDAIIFGPLLFSFPLFIVFIIAGVVIVIGPVPTIVGAATLLFFFCVQTCLAKVNVRLRQKCVVFTDKRTRLMNEVLNCVKLIKMYSWEESFAKNLANIRYNERKYLTRAGVLQSFTMGLSVTIGPAVVLMSVITYTLLGNVITAARAFTLLQLFGSLTSALYVLPLAMKPISESIVAFKRIKPILLMDETTREWNPPSDPEHAVEIVNASFSWDAPPTEENDNTVNGPSVDGKSTKYKLVNGDRDEKEDAEKGVKEQDEKDATVSDGLLENTGETQGPTITLKSINLVVPRSHLVGICGSVGSGKSSLLNTLLDQLNLLDGRIAAKGSFAYAAQQAWITNASVKDNILFGEPYDEQRYKKAIFSCCLERDLEIMSDGDRTEIGERGVNVSGGQKQRISLARAYYSDRDIYLLDDPLSAVDAHVGKHIFTHCIHGVLRGKTVLFVTHQLQYLRDCDYVVLMRDGKIAEQGTHDGLVAAGSEYARLIDTFHGKGEDDEEDVNEAIPEIKHDDENMNKEESSQAEISEHKEEADEETEEKEETEVVKLIGEEDQGHGTVAFATYKSFVHFTGSRFWAFLVPFLMFMTMLSSIFTNIWLSIWIQAATVWRNQTQVPTSIPEVSTSSPWLSATTLFMNNSSDDFIINSTDGAANDYYDEYAFTTSSANAGDGQNSTADGIAFFMAIYAGIFGLTYFFLIVSSFVFIVTVLRATTRIHDSLLRKIMRCPMSFFDTTPLGRILNRFSKDMDEVDLLLPMNLQRCLFFLSCVIIIQGFFVSIFPFYGVVLVIVLAVGIFLYVMFRKGYCEIKRMDNTTRSKVVSHISATMQGLTTIKAYGQGKRFTTKFEELLDTNSLIMELFFMAPRWTAARMDLLSSVLLLVLCALILIFKSSLFSPAIAAMAIGQAISISGGLLQEVILSCTQTESSFLSVERMLEYIEQSPSEADAHIKETAPPEEWPQDGDLKLQKVEMRYRDNLPLVLKGITCHILPKEKIGIVGRTGSGKSTLGVSLFRLVENVSGKIILDDVDVSTIGLHDLRSKLSIIPQDPVLFAGTIRFNLDPLGNHTDEELWSALEKTYVKQTVSGLDNQLEAPVIENGENFSVGERQLMCMARALLRNSKVLLMDEATAAIDTETDSLIQQTIREAFKDCTMLIIAHRLNTILDCDKIMLMDSGEIAEFDTPDVLQGDPNSLFSGMLAAAKHNKGSLDE
ncbi:multidrug resistance-associated protein 5-like isoform X2 [Acanthaster planci]|uniref:Multidrug resistance-associated protein 5-like isoform X2 n=1 Tax=Acanthaster planci TaxID=133434 RepID=A0A8B7YZ13_ACAPL|nr:multidrug resistance-associated protein 5-like isoform X2 [Acanthaster planci]